MKKINFWSLLYPLLLIVLFVLFVFCSLKITNGVHSDFSNSVNKDRTEYNEFVDEFLSKDYTDSETYIMFIEEQRRLANVNYDYQQSIFDIIRDGLCMIFILVCFVGIVFSLVSLISSLLKLLFSNKSEDSMDDSIVEEIIILDNQPNDCEVKSKFTYDDSIYDI